MTVLKAKQTNKQKKEQKKRKKCVKMLTSMLNFVYKYMYISPKQSGKPSMYNKEGGISFKFTIFGFSIFPMF